MPWAAIVPSVVASMVLSANTANVSQQWQQQWPSEPVQPVPESNPLMDSLTVLLEEDRASNTAD